MGAPDTPPAERGYHTAEGEMHRRYKQLAPYVPELIDMRFGERGAIQLTFSPHDWPRHRPALEEFCRQVGFHLSGRLVLGEHKVLLSREPPPSWKAKDQQLILGQLFRYPRCCVAAFDAQVEAATKNPFINQTGTLYRDVPALPFELNPFLRASPFHLFKHFPCAADCPATLAGARRVLDLVRTHQPGLARDIERFNRWPVLYTDVCGFGISLDGSVQGHRVRYREAVHDGHPRSLQHLARHNRPEDLAVFEQLSAWLQQGDQVELDPDAITVGCGGREIGRVRRPAHLHWQLMRFG
jgi:hypothetical protein